MKNEIKIYMKSVAQKLRTEMKVVISTTANKKIKQRY